jgi:hypothetical protein
MVAEYLEKAVQFKLWPPRRRTLRARQTIAESGLA